MSKPHAFGAALLWLLLSATAAMARPYTIDDMLGLEGYGEIAAQPHSNLLIVEKLGPYDSAPAYPYGPFSRRLTSHIFFRAIAGDGPLRPLFNQDAKAGYWSGGFSPSGHQLVVYRLDTARLQIGIVDMATRLVRWLPDRPDLPLTTPDPVWLDEHRLLLVTRQDDRPPELLDSFGSTQRELPKLARQVSIIGWVSNG